MRARAATRTPTDDTVPPDSEPKSIGMTSTRDTRGTEETSPGEEWICRQDVGSWAVIEWEIATVVKKVKERVLGFKLWAYNAQREYDRR